MGQPNWAKLIQQGRAKAYGVPWSPEEVVARYTHNIPAEYVRDGILDPKDYEAALAADEEEGTPLSRLSREELLHRAEGLGLTFGAETDDPTLRELISKAEAAPAEKPAKAEKAEKAPAKKPAAKKAVKKAAPKKSAPKK